MTPNSTDTMTTETTTPRVTLDAITAAIKSERYVNLGLALESAGVNLVGAPDLESVGATGRTTLCVITLDNDIVVIGTSACVDARLFDAQVGREIARRDAIGKIWPLLGMRLADRVAKAAAMGGAFDPMTLPLAGDERFGPYPF